MTPRCRPSAATTHGPRPSSHPGGGLRLVGGVLAAAALLLSGCTSTPSSSGTGSPPGSTAHTDPTRWLVTLGDSYISGEGARWAGNTSGHPGPVDALGPGAYASQAGRGSESGCDRALTSVAALRGGPFRGRNLACSGATVASHGTGHSFVPGLDWYDDGRGHVSQLVALRRFASHHDVGDIVVSIGGNDFGFGSVLGSCVSDFVSAVGRPHPAYCKADPSVVDHFSRASAAAVTRRIALALGRVEQAMRMAGRPTTSYALIVETYPSPVAPGARIRYPQNLLQRLFIGGCPVFDADATWANRVVVPTINDAVTDAVAASDLPNVAELDLRRAFDGHRLCEKGAHQLQQTRLDSWRSAGARAQLEWVNELYVKSSPWRAVESFHPNYWGTLAERRCVLSAVRALRVRSGVCRAGTFRQR